MINWQILVVVLIVWMCNAKNSLWSIQYCQKIIFKRQYCIYSRSGVNLIMKNKHECLHSLEKYLSWCTQKYVSAVIWMWWCWAWCYVDTRWRTRFIQCSKQTLQWNGYPPEITCLYPSLYPPAEAERQRSFDTARGRSKRTAVEVRVLFMTRRTPWIKRKGMDLATFHFCYILIVLITGMFFWFFSLHHRWMLEFVVVMLLK